MNPRYLFRREPDGGTVGDAVVEIMQPTRRHSTTTKLPLRLDLANHSPTGFQWGYGGSGPAQLAPGSVRG